MVMQDIEVKDWSQDFLAEQKPRDTRPKLKIQDGEQVEVTFLDEGKVIDSLDYGKAILFSVQVKGEEMVWFVSTKKFSLLREIAHNKPVVTKVARVTRIGKGKADTRWSIKFLEAKP